MSPLTFDQIVKLLPDLDEVRPMIGHAMAISTPDASRRWAGSEEVGTSARRLVDTEALHHATHQIAEAESAHIHRLLGLVAESLDRVQSGDSIRAAESLLEAAALEEARDRPTQAAAWADSAVRMGEGRPADEVTARALRRRARAHRTRGALAEAERDYLRAWDIGRALGDVQGTAEAAIGAGNVYEEQGQWDEASVWYRHALGALEASDQLLPEKWHALINLHVALRWTGAVDASVAPLEKAAEVARLLADPTAEQFIENARGQLCMARGQHADAEGHYKLALESSSGARASVTIRLNLAEALFAVGRRLEAAEAVRLAESESIRAGLSQKLPEAYRLLGRLAAAEGNPEAFVFFEHALELIRSQGLPGLESAMTLQAYAEVEAKVGEDEAAQELLQRADQLYRELGIHRRRSEWADRLESVTDSSHEPRE